MQLVAVTSGIARGEDSPVQHRPDIVGQITTGLRGPSLSASEELRAAGETNSHSESACFRPHWGSQG